MRGIFIIILAGILMVAGCAQPVEDGNNTTNGTNVTPPVEECAGPVCGSDGETYPTDCEAELAGVSILHEGACVVEENCTETDSGIDVDAQGSASKGNETKEDYCLDSGQLVEYTCLDNAIDMATVQCGAGKECKEGKCAPMPPPQNETEPGCAGPSETDLLVKGSVKYNGSEYSDSCVEYRIVKEWYCKDDKAEFINNICDSGFGCMDGICEKQQYLCSDSDGGKNLTGRGRTIVTYGLFATPYDETDECEDIGMVTEHYCLVNGSAASEGLECGSGRKCDAGRCIESDCTETDAGFDIYKRGESKEKNQDDEDEASVDECLDDYELREFFCYGDDVTSDDVLCPDGYICRNDKCVEGSIS